MDQEENPQRIPPTPPPIRPREEASFEEKPASVVPTGDVFVRTMEGDIKAPKPEEVLPPEEGRDIEIKQETVVPPMPEASRIAELPELETPKKPIWFFVIGGIVIAAVSFVLGYFVVFPLIFPAKEAITVTEQQPSVSTTPTVTAPQKIEHKSLFAIQPAKVTNARVSPIDFLSISLALQTGAAARLTDGSIGEVVILDQNDSQISYSEFLAQFLSSANKTQLEQWFENDFSAYLYYDRNGVWPGYVAKIKRNPSLQTLLENPSNAANFYLTAPNTFSSFKDGKINGYATRYSVGSKAGASFNYGTFGNYFIISTSFDGLKAAVKLLGL